MSRSKVSLHPEKAMASHRIRRALMLAVLVGLGAGLHGCHAEDCREAQQCGSAPELRQAPEPNCDPAQGEIGASCAGVYVSSTLGSDDNPGTQDRPVRSAIKALEIAREGSRRVYLCAERFAESITVTPGVEIWGGLDCSTGWGYVGEARKTTIAPEPGVIPLRFVAGEDMMTVADVHAEAADAVFPGDSSIAAFVSPGAVVEILRSELVAGHGAAGAPGQPGADFPAPSGAAGSPGGAACSTVTVQGGAGGVNHCTGINPVGGLGGYGSATQGGSGTDGTPSPVPNQQGTGLGGAGWNGGLLCELGTDGGQGTAGQDGEGARGSGWITENGWAGAPGHDGANGLPGQGGGAGGGSRGGAMFCGSALGGASGGGGGAGGCGGSGGKGGGYGGGSIGLLMLSGNVTIRATSLRTASGGDGGAGGVGQDGGLPGPGGEGGQSVNNSPPGCRGGDGGAGGGGGHGGGGVGGPSIGIAYLFGLAPAQEDVSIQVGEAGAGGLGGNPYVTGSAGDDGVSAEIASF